MTESVRAFFGLRIRAARKVRQVLDELDAMGRPVKPVDPSGLHVTLKFLGDTEAQQLTHLQQALRAAVSRQQPFDVVLQGLGAFPRVARPAVVWMGVSEAGDPATSRVTDLARELDRLLRELGFPAETRSFHPHLTLARIRGRPPERLLQLLADLQTAEFGCQPIAQVHLMASRSTGRRTSYVDLDTVHLGAGD